MKFTPEVKNLQKYTIKVVLFWFGWLNQVQKTLNGGLIKFLVRQDYIKDCAKMNI